LTPILSDETPDRNQYDSLNQLNVRESFCLEQNFFCRTNPFSLFAKIRLEIAASTDADSPPQSPLFDAEATQFALHSHNWLGLSWRAACASVLTGCTRDGGTEAWPIHDTTSR
jgi:hypothetical protein